MFLRLHESKSPPSWLTLGSPHQLQQPLGTFLSFPLGWRAGDLLLGDLDRFLEGDCPLLSVLALDCEEVDKAA